MSEKSQTAAELGARGGKASADALTPEERKERGRRAATKRWSRIPTATHEGVLTIGDATIPCAVLEGGIRVISQRGMSAALGRHVTGSGTSKSKPAEPQIDGVAKLPNFVSAANLKQFIDLDLAASLTEPLEYRPQHGGRTAYGFNAELFPRICDVWLKAKDAGVLTDKQEETAKKAYVLMRALAHVAIIALVDEATGFQDVRARDALAKILEAFIAEELRKWIPTFSPKFYKEMFRLKGLKFDGSTKRPQYFGHLTNDLVYSRLAPGVLEELKNRNPVVETGRRRSKHHQWLTGDIGHPALREHIEAVSTLMAASDTWDQFYKMLSRTKPVYKGVTLFDECE
jgi:hypothetical protein